MDISCDVIRDLLPLYAEELVSEDSRKLVDEHLCRCEPCSRQWKSLQKADKLQLELDTGSLKRIRDAIRRRRLLTVFAAVMTAIAVMISAMGWLLVDIWADAEDAVVFVEEQEDGSLRLLLEDSINGVCSHGWRQEDYPDELYATAFQTTRLDRFRAKWDDLVKKETRPNFYVLENNRQALGEWAEPNLVPDSAMEEIPMAGTHHWFLDVYRGELGTKLWGEGTEVVPQPDLPVSGRMRNIFFGTVGVFLVFLTLVFCCRKSGRMREIFMRMTILSGCGIFSFWYLTGGKFLSLAVSDEPEGTLKWIAVITLLLAMSIHSWRLVYRSEKG